MSAPLLEISEDAAAEALTAFVSDDLEIAEDAVPTAVQTGEGEGAAEPVEAAPVEAGEVETAEAEAAETDEETTDEEPEEDDAATSAIELESLADLGEAIELETEQLLDLKYQFKASGQEFDVPLREVVQMAQEGVDATKKRQEAAQLKRDLATEQQQLFQRAQAHEEQLAAQYGATMQMFQQELSDIEYLRTADPTEYLLKKEQLEGRRNQLVQNAATNAQAFKTREHEQAQQAMKYHGEELTRAVPDWGDDNSKRVIETLKSYKYTDKEIAGTYDHRVLQMIDDFAQLKAENETLRTNAEKKAAATKEAVKRVKKKVPRVPRAAPTNGKVQVSAKSAKQFARLRKSGDPKDAVPLLVGLFE